ncbi:sodium-transporting two-sector ATPase [Candidatus Saccharibacteria bacterium]|nr:sodium-transporting two-sector ATPase [Candidatus Saccharibacteria bacterium]
MVKDTNVISRQKKLTAEVIAIRECIVLTTPLTEAPIFAEVAFAGGARGVVWQIDPDGLEILLLSDQPVKAGELVTIVSPELSLPVGENILGRVIDPLGRPLDGQGYIKTSSQAPYFRSAPTFQQRDDLDEQLVTGVSYVDTLLPIVKGQRIAIMGDSKSGKTSFMTQAAIAQARAGRVVVYVLVAKRRIEVNRLVEVFKAAKVMSQITLVVTVAGESLPLGVLAPYAGCAVGEYFWHQKKDVVVLYDDFSNLAKLYREMSLLLRNNVGREAYPGDMFHVQSALLERAGKLRETGSSQTILVAGSTPNNDLTSYQATSLISMTDGQIVFDTEVLHRGISPAINLNLSVSRIGGRSQSSAMQRLSATVTQELANFHSAEEYTRFSDQMSEFAQREIILGKQLIEAFIQSSDEFYSLAQQRVILEVILRQETPVKMNIAELKETVQKKLPGNKSVTENDISALAGSLMKRRHK